MKKLLLLLLCLPLIISCVKNQNSSILYDKENLQDFDFKNGDIIFQTSKSQQSKLIQEVTQSKFSHVGILYIEEDYKISVFEAGAKVKLTPLSQWINNGVENQYVIKRYKYDINLEDMNKMYEYCIQQKGMSYDWEFQWTDNEMYCSELVWKAYKSINIELSIISTFANLPGMNSNKIQKEIEKRYRECNDCGEFNKHEYIVSPEDLYQSEKLIKIFSNY